MPKVTEPKEVSLEEQSVFVDVKIKNLPKSLQTRLKSYRKQQDKLSKQLSKLRDQESNDLRELIIKGVNRG